MTLTFESTGQSMHLSGALCAKYLSNTTMTAIMRQLQQQPTDHLTLDLQHIEKIDTVGLSWLILLQHNILKSNKTLQIVACPSDIYQFIKQSGITATLNLT